MMALVMIMGYIRCQRVLQSLFPKENQPLEAWPEKWEHAPSRPENRHAIQRKARIMGHHRQLMELRLGNQHAVKGIAVVAGQSPSDQRVRNRDGEWLEAMRGELRLEVVGDVEPPLGALDTHFPGARRADKHLRLPRCDSCSGRRTQRGIVRQPPEEGVSIEEEHQGASPSKAAVRSGGNSSKSGAIRTRPRHEPGTRGRSSSRYGTSLASGFPARAMIISSPWATWSSKRERCVLAS